MLEPETAANIVAQGNPQNRFHIDGGLLELIIARPKLSVIRCLLLDSLSH